MQITRGDSGWVLTVGKNEVMALPRHDERKGWVKGWVDEYFEDMKKRVDWTRVHSTRDANQFYFAIPDEVVMDA